jgi:two-component system cell cycle response regulator DivK
MKTILIVEDNDKNLKLARDVLEVKGYATLEARNAEDGLALVRERRPDLVLMDIHLPGMSGLEALAALRADPAVASIPVVAVTASVMHHDVARITGAGFDGYVAKPISLATFLETVRSVLERTAP